MFTDVNSMCMLEQKNKTSRISDRTGQNKRVNQTSTCVDRQY